MPEGKVCKPTFKRRSYGEHALRRGRKAEPTNERGEGETDPVKGKKQERWVVSGKKGDLSMTNCFWIIYSEIFCTV